jgi:hypothetical protein
MQARRLRACQRRQRGQDGAGSRRLQEAPALRGRQEDRVSYRMSAFTGKVVGRLTL